MAAGNPMFNMTQAFPQMMMASAAGMHDGTMGQPGA